MLGNLDHAHDHWCNGGGLACLVAGLQKVLCLAADLNKSGWGWVVLKSLHEVNTLVNGSEEVIMIDSAVGIDSLFVLAGPVCVLKFLVDSFLFGEVVGKKSLAAV